MEGMNPIRSFLMSSHIYYMFSEPPFLITKNGDNKARVWGVEQSNGNLILLRTFNLEMVGAIVTNQDYLFSAYKNDSIRCWSLQNFERLPHNFQMKMITTFSISNCGGKTSLFASSFEGKVSIWDVASGKLKANFVAHNDIVGCVKSYNEDYFLTGSTDSSVKLWDHRKLDNPVYTFNGHQSMVFGIELRKDDPTVLSYSADGQALLWNITNGVVNSQIQLDYCINRVARSEDRIALQGSDFVELFDLSGNRVNTLVGHNGNITSLNVFDEYFYTGSMDRSVKIWHKNGKEVATLTGNKDQVTSVTKYQNWIYTGGFDGSIKQYTTPY